MSKRWNNKQRYALYGAIFGVVFPIIACVIRVIQHGTRVAAGEIIGDPLFWIIFTAPLFLGIFSYIAGIKQDATELTLEQLADEQAATERKVHDAVAIIRQQEEIARRKDAEMLAMTEKALEETSFAHKVQSEFLANISHELRTPIASILGFVEILREENRIPSNDVLFQMILRSGNGLLTIINDLLDLAHLEAKRLAPEPVPTTISAVLNDVVNLFATSALTKHLRIEAKTDEIFPEKIYVDARRVRQILYNLVGNAVKFTEQGEVLVQASYLLSSVSSPRALLRLTISDTGVGMSEEYQQRLFGRFHQQDGSATRVHGGLGVGLALTKGLVEMLDGVITVQSKQNVGTTVIVEIPIQFD